MTGVKIDFPSVVPNLSRCDACCKGRRSATIANPRRNRMSAEEFAYTAFALTSFAVLRIGIPVLAMIL